APIRSRTLHTPAASPASCLPGTTTTSARWRGCTPLRQLVCAPPADRCGRSRRQACRRQSARRDRRSERGGELVGTRCRRAEETVQLEPVREGGQVAGVSLRDVAGQLPVEDVAGLV